MCRSISSVDEPAPRAKAVATLTASVVVPTPPFPPRKATTCTGSRAAGLAPTRLTAAMSSFWVTGSVYESS